VKPLLARLLRDLGKQKTIKAILTSSYFVTPFRVCKLIRAGLCDSSTKNITLTFILVEQTGVPKASPRNNQQRDAGFKQSLLSSNKHILVDHMKTKCTFNLTKPDIFTNRDLPTSLSINPLELRAAISRRR
jgi:hypothetical protein